MRKCQAPWTLVPFSALSLTIVAWKGASHSHPPICAKPARCDRLDYAQIGILAPLLGDGEKAGLHPLFACSGLRHFESAARSFRKGAWKFPSDGPTMGLAMKSYKILPQFLVGFCFKRDISYLPVASTYNKLQYISSNFPYRRCWCYNNQLLGLKLCCGLQNGQCHKTRVDPAVPLAALKKLITQRLRNCGLEMNRQPEQPIGGRGTV